MALALTLPAVKAGAETDLGLLMGQIGVPVADAVYFGWNPIVPPEEQANLDMIDRWNFGMAMYQHGTALRFTFVNGQTSTPHLSSVFTSFLFADGDADGSGVYFHSGRTIEDEPPLSDPLLWTSGGVDFVQGGGTLPEGNTLSLALGGAFDTTDSISWVRDSGQTAQYNGVHNGVNAIPEYVTFEYDFEQNVDFEDVYFAFLNRDLRIGTHVQGFNGVPEYNEEKQKWEAYGSEAILWSVYTDVTPPPPGPLTSTPVPVPGAASLGLLGFGLIAAARRKARK